MQGNASKVNDEGTEQDSLRKRKRSSIQRKARVALVRLLVTVLWPLWREGGRGAIGPVSMPSEVPVSVADATAARAMRFMGGTRVHNVQLGAFGDA